MKRREFIALLGGAAAAWPLAAQQPKTARIGALYIGVADAESFKKELREGLELDSGRIHVRRAKNGVDSTHPLTGKEIRALRQLRRENLQSCFVFNTERSRPVTRAWFLKMVRRTGELAKLPFPIHPHMLRHACGFKLANDGVDTRALQHFLGHRNIMHTVRYTELRSDRFDGFWKD